MLVVDIEVNVLRIKNVTIQYITFLLAHLIPQELCSYFTNDYCQAQFQLASSVPVQLRTEISLIITVSDKLAIH